MSEQPELWRDRCFSAYRHAAKSEAILINALPLDLPSVLTFETVDPLLRAVFRDLVGVERPPIGSPVTPHRALWFGLTAVANNVLHGCGQALSAAWNASLLADRQALRSTAGLPLWSDLDAQQQDKIWQLHHSLLAMVANAAALAPNSKAPATTFTETERVAYWLGWLCGQLAHDDYGASFSAMSKDIIGFATEPSQAAIEHIMLELARRYRAGWRLRPEPEDIPGAADGHREGAGGDMSDRMDATHGEAAREGDLTLIQSILVASMKRPNERGCFEPLPADRETWMRGVRDALRWFRETGIGECLAVPSYWRSRCLRSEQRGEQLESSLYAALGVAVHQ